MRRALGLLAALISLLVCLIAAALLWQPQEYLFRLTYPQLSGLFQELNFLSHLYPNYPQVSLALLALATAGALLALLSGPIEFASDGPPAPASPLPGVWRSRSVVVLGLAGVANVALWVALVGDHYHWGLFYAWGLSLGVGAWAWRTVDMQRGLASGRPLALPELTFLVVLACSFILYCAYDLDHWRYSFMGDELGFWGYARFVVQDRLPDGRPGIVNAFTQEGVALYHPMMCTLYQSWFMRLFGVQSFAWRLSSVVAATLALPGFYLFLRETISRPAAVVGVVVLAGNHFLLTYAHHGLNNVQVLAPTVTALGLWVWGSKRDNLLALYASGVAAGLGFYTFYSSRLAVAFVVLGLLLVPLGLPWRRRIGQAIAFAFGFLLTFTPLVAASPNFVGDMLHQSVMRVDATETTASETEGAVERLWKSINDPQTRTKWEACWSDPLMSLREGRFLWGSWTDSWIGSLFLVGLTWSSLRWPRRPFLLWLLASYFASVVAIGVLTQHGFPTDTRMLFLVPFYITFAVLALDVWRNQLRALPLPIGRGGTILLAGAAILSIALNQHRFRVESPSRYSVAPFGLVTKVAQQYPEAHIYFVAPPIHDFSILHDLATVYLYADRIEVLRTDTIARGEERVVRPAAFVFARMFPEPIEDTVELLRQRYPIEQAQTHIDGSGHNSLRSFYVPAR